MKAFRVQVIVDFGHYKNQHECSVDAESFNQAAEKALAAYNQTVVKVYVQSVMDLSSR